MPINDTCLYLESTAGDGGNHTDPIQWLSPDLFISAPDNLGRATPGSATTPLANTINVRVHKKAECSIDAEVVLIDVYVGDPSLTMTPGSNTVQLTNVQGRPIGSIDLTVTPPPTVAGTVFQITWDLKLVASGPESPGHKCLIARVYRDVFDNPPGGTFGAPDQHVVQRNICIIPCGSPCGQDVQTTNLNRKQAEKTIIRAVADLQPSRHVLKVVRPLLKAAKGFKRLNTKRPPRFRLEFEKAQDAESKDHTGKPGPSGSYGRLKVPNFETRLTLKKAQTVKFRFMTDLEGTAFGDAFIFHLMHIGANRQVQGGLTVVAVRTNTGTW